MRFLTFGKRNFKEVVRDRIALGFLLGMPIAFMLIFALAFGGDEVAKNKVVVVDEDHSPLSRAFVEMALKSKPVAETLEVSATERPQAMDDLKNRKVEGVLIIPAGFGEQVGRYQTEGQADIVLEVICDESNFIGAQRIRSIINTVGMMFVGIKIPLQVISKPIAVEMKGGFINFFVPGMVVFGLMILIPGIAGLTVRDKQSGFLARLLTTPTRPSDFILGYSVPFVLLAIAQIAIYLVVARLVGWEVFGHGAAQLGHIVLAFLVFLIMGLCAIGIGMIVAALVKTEQQADAGSWIFIVPLTMLSGAWWPVEMMHPVMRHIAAVLPMGRAADAARDIINMGAGFGAIWEDLAVLAGWALVLYLIGVLLFRRRVAL